MPNGSVPEQASRTALILVRNAVAHDSRVLREARTLRELGFDVLIAGVTTTEDPDTETQLDGFSVIRLTRSLGLRRFVKRQRDSRHSPRALTTPGATAADSMNGVAARPAGGHRPWKHPTARRLASTTAYYLQGIALVRRTSPALVHANDYNTMWIGLAARLLRRSRLVYDAHELWPDRGGPEWRPWLLACEWLFSRLANATVASNTAISETLAKRYGIRAPVVVRNVPERPGHLPDRREGLRAGKAPLAMYVGGLMPGRGIEQTIQALASVPQLRLRLMGQGAEEYKDQLERLAAELGVAERVEYRSPVPPPAVAEAIAGADMGIVLTQPVCLNNVLSLPNKLFEYTAAGLPVVASDLPLLGALVREEGIGMAVPPADVDALARALAHLGDPERNAEVREHVLVFAERTTWAEERPLLEGVYTSVMPRGHDRHG